MSIKLHTLSSNFLKFEFETLNVRTKSIRLTSLVSVHHTTTITRYTQNQLVWLWKWPLEEDTTCELQFYICKLKSVYSNALHAKMNLTSPKVLNHQVYNVIHWMVYIRKINFPIELRSVKNIQFLFLFLHKCTDSSIFKIYKSSRVASK